MAKRKVSPKRKDKKMHKMPGGQMMTDEEMKKTMKKKHS